MCPSVKMLHRYRNCLNGLLVEYEMVSIENHPNLLGFPQTRSHYSIHQKWHILVCGVVAAADFKTEMLRNLIRDKGGRRRGLWCNRTMMSRLEVNLLSVCRGFEMEKVAKLIEIFVSWQRTWYQDMSHLLCDYWSGLVRYHKAAA